jgi:hypothetical protein
MSDICDSFMNNWNLCLCIQIRSIETTASNGVLLNQSIEPELLLHTLTKVPC